MVIVKQAGNVPGYSKCSAKVSRVAMVVMGLVGSIHFHVSSLHPAQSMGEVLESGSHMLEFIHSHKSVDQLLLASPCDTAQTGKKRGLCPLGKTATNKVWDVKCT